MKSEKFRDRKFMLLLYPDNEQHCIALDKIQQSFHFACILHDKDVDDNGEVKKAHWHVVIKLLSKNPIWSSALAKELGIEEKFIEKPRSLENALLYLIHYNDSNKTQYNIEEVFGPLKKVIAETINKNEKTEGEKVAELINYIKEHKGRIRITEFASFCAENGYWAEFRRSGSIFCKIIEEHNLQYEVKDNK